MFASANIENVEGLALSQQGKPQAHNGKVRDLQLGLDLYRASVQYQIPNTIGHSCTNTHTDIGLYKFFVMKMRFCAGYRCVQVTVMGSN